MKIALAAIALGLTLAAPLAAQSAPRIAGEWNGTMNTPGAQVPLTLVFTVKGDSLGGKAVRASGDVPLTGRVKGDSVIFQYTIQYNDSPFTMLLRGRVTGDSLGGIVDFGGGNEDGFSAKRAAPRPAGPRDR